MPFVDRNSTDMIRATISVTDYCNWDFVKIMTTGHYVPEAWGGNITYSIDPHHWYGTINRYPVTNLEELNALPILDETNPVFRRETATARGLVEHYQGRKPVLATIFTPLTCLQELMSRGTNDKTLPLMLEHKKETHQALQKIVESNFHYLDMLIEQAHIDGIFFANQYSSRDVISPELYDEFCAPYDRQILAHVKGRTWFNILHVHGEKNLMFDKCVNYDVQAFSWENCVPGIPKEDISSVRQVRAMTDKILITGLARHYDYYSERNDRQELVERFRSRLKDVMEGSGDNRVVFAPGCALPMDVDRYVFTLMDEVVQQEGYVNA